MAQEHSLPVWVLHNEQLDVDTGQVLGEYYVLPDTFRAGKARKRNPTFKEVYSNGYCLCEKVGKRLFGHVPHLEIKKMKITVE